MIKFRQFRVRSFSLEYFDLYWEIEPTQMDLQEWDFYVERSEVENGDWPVLAGPLVDQYYLRDNTVHARSETRTWFYRIRAVHRLEGWEVTSEVQDVFGPEDLIAAEIIRSQYVMFREHAGYACWVFNRRTFGQTCPSCYDPRLGKRTDEQCQVCWGTGFSGGYHRPVKFWGRLSRSDVEDLISLDDRRVPVYGSLDTSPSPDIRPHDLVIDAQNNRFVAVRVGGPTRLGVSVRQTLTLTKVERGSVEDLIPLNIDLAAEELRAPRNFTNPQNLDEARDVDLEQEVQPRHRY